MYEIDNKLLELERQGTPVRCGLIGTGQMGTEIVIQAGMMRGFEVDVAVDLHCDTVERAYRQGGYTGDIVRTDSPEEARLAIARGAKVATTNSMLPMQTGPIQAVVDATGSPEMGARVALECFHHKKHIVMMNVECDVTVGPILHRMARQAGVVYSLTAGDEPGSIVEVYRFVNALGYRVLAVGKGKNNPLDHYATPGDAAWKRKAEERNMSPRMLIEFVDGSKTMVEMCAVSNATGLRPDVRGMHGPQCTVAQLPRVMCKKEDGGILTQEGVVEFAIGDINPGVFVIFTTDNPRMREALVQRDMGSGPNYLLMRPYHLCSIETPLTAAQAVLYGESTAHPMDRMTSECITIAKQDLRKGQVLDNIGEYCYRASIELAEVARAENMLPVGLAKGAVLNCDVPRDTVITYDMVTPNDTSVLLQLRRIQDQTM